MDKQEDNGIGVSGKLLVQRLLQLVKVKMAFIVTIAMIVMIVIVVMM